MNKIYSHNRLAKRVFLAVLSLGLTVVAMLAVYSSYGAFTKTMDSIKYRKLSEANLGALTVREEGLKTKVRQLESESGLEKEIRERFPVAKKGEEVIMLVNKGDSASVVDEQSNLTLWEKLGNWWESF